MKISLLCPSRGRPDDLARFYNFAFGLAAERKQLELVVRVDDDDPAIEGYQMIAYWDFATLLVGPRNVNLSQLWNECHAVASGELFMLCGDDLVMRTRGWDARFRHTFAAIPDRIAYVYGDDLIWHQQLGTHGMIHRNWVDAVGYFCPPYFEADCNDSWLHEVAQLVDRLRYLPDVVTEHLHATVGKAPKDTTHLEQRQRRIDYRIEARWAEMERLRRADAEKLRAAMVSGEA